MKREMVTQCEFGGILLVSVCQRGGNAEFLMAVGSDPQDLEGLWIIYDEELLFILFVLQVSFAEESDELDTMV